MNHLIIFANPNPASFGNAICNELKRVSEAKGNTVRVRNLYETGFNPVRSADDAIEGGATPGDIKAEQAYIAEADHITFIYPVWWGSMPAIMKGYIDRVFSYGFAYSYDETGVQKLLVGKCGSMICTTGSTDEAYEKSGIHAAMRLIASEVIFGFCGIEPVKTLFLGNIAGISHKDRENLLAQLQGQFADVL